MAVHTLGNTTAPTTGANDTSAYNEIGPHSGNSMPANGYVTTLFGYFGATSGTMSANLLLFNGTTYVANTPTFTAGGQTWQSGSGFAPYFLAAGSDVRVGWYVNAMVHFSVYSGGNWEGQFTSLPPRSLNGNVPGSPYFQGGLGFYVQWIDPLSVSGVSPSIAAVGQSVTVSGAGFVGGSITGVTVNGVSAAWSVTDDAHLSVTVPSGATSGSLQVNSDHGSGSTSLTISSAYLTRSGSEVSSQGIFLTRSGSQSQAQGVLRYLNGVWVNAQ